MVKSYETINQWCYGQNWRSHEQMMSWKSTEKITKDDVIKKHEATSNESYDEMIYEEPINN